MKIKLEKFLPLLITLVLTGALYQTAFAAASNDLSLTDSNVRFSTNTFLEGKFIRIYASVTNNSSEDLLGTVRFYDNDDQVNGDQAISLFGNKTDDVFVDWKPNYGSHKITVRIFPWDKDSDDPSNNEISRTIFVQQDTDYDGITNDQDPDDDNDGVTDAEDPFPLNKNESVDTDGDGTGNNADPDDDNDGVPDDKDDLPLDPTETTDTDKDGIGDIADPDDDNDGVSDAKEMNEGTDPANPDTDNDTVNDGTDPFPTNSSEWSDNDKDLIGDNADIDDDNDGILDKDDKFPLNKAPVLEVNRTSTETATLDQEKTFDASKSYDEDGKIISYNWTIDNKYFAKGPIVTHRFDTLGKHEVKLTIKDSSGESVTEKFQVNVLNIRLYSQIFTLIITFALAGILAFKYLAKEKNK